MPGGVVPRRNWTLFHTREWGVNSSSDGTKMPVMGRIAGAVALGFDAHRPQEKGRQMPACALVGLRGRFLGTAWTCVLDACDGRRRRVVAPGVRLAAPMAAILARLGRRRALFGWRAACRLAHPGN